MVRRKRVILIGPMGAGKTSVGMQLAALLNFNFIDADSVIQHQEQLNISEIFLSKGEKYFRQQESKILANVIIHNSAIIATGGGCILSVLNRNILTQSGLVLYLKASPDTQIKRLLTNFNRPLLPLDFEKKIQYLQQTALARAGFYESIADYILDTDGANVHELAQSAYNYWAR